MSTEKTKITEFQHKQQIAQNRQFLMFILNQGYSDWVITVAFYLALHSIEWYLSKKDIYSGNHDERFKNIRKVPELIPIHNKYRVLYRKSKEARYLCQLSYLKRKEVDEAIDISEEIQAHIYSLSSDFPFESIKNL